MDVLLRKGSPNNYARTIVINVDYQRKTKEMSTQVITGAGEWAACVWRRDRKSRLQGSMAGETEPSTERRPRVCPTTGVDAPPHQKNGEQSLSGGGEQGVVWRGPGVRLEDLSSGQRWP